jgi:PAS domain S-box-containing protein
VPDMMTWRTDRSGIWTEVSESWISQVGRSVESLHGDGWLQIVHPRDRERVRKEDMTLRATGQSYFQFYRVRLAVGAYQHVRVRVSPVCRHGEIVGHVSMVTHTRPSIRFGKPLIASICRPTPLVVAPATIAEDEDTCQRVAAAVE